MYKWIHHVLIFIPTFMLIFYSYQTSQRKDLTDFKTNISSTSLSQHWQMTFRYNSRETRLRSNTAAGELRYGERDRRKRNGAEGTRGRIESKKHRGIVECSCTMQQVLHQHRSRIIVARICGIRPSRTQRRVCGPLLFVQVDFSSSITLERYGANLI